MRPILLRCPNVHIRKKKQSKLPSPQCTRSFKWVHHFFFSGRPHHLFFPFSLFLSLGSHVPPPLPLPTTLTGQICELISGGDSLAPFSSSPDPSPPQPRGEARIYSQGGVGGANKS